MFHETLIKQEKLSLYSEFILANSLIPTYIFSVAVFTIWDFSLLGIDSTLSLCCADYSHDILMALICSILFPPRCESILAVERPGRESYIGSREE